MPDQNFRDTLLETEKVEGAKLWLALFDALGPLGRNSEAKDALKKADILLREANTPAARVCQARLHRKNAGVLRLEGQPEQAEKELQTALAAFIEEGDLRSQAGVRGELAHLRAKAGDTAGALSLYQEELGIYEYLGDTRGRALVLGDIVNLKAEASEKDLLDALKLHQERLAVFDKHEDLRSRAMTLGELARIRLRLGDKAGALELQKEKLTIMERLGDVRQCASTSSEISRLQNQTNTEAARKVEEQSLETARRMNDVAGIAHTQYSLARLDLREGLKDRALMRLAESWNINKTTGRADGIAFVGELYGQLLVPTDRPQALSVLQASREAFRKLGQVAKVSQLDDLLKRLSGDQPGK